MIYEKRAKSGFPAISPVLARHTLPSSPWVLSYYTSIDHNNLKLPSPRYKQPVSSSIFAHVAPATSSMFSCVLRQHCVGSTTTATTLRRFTTTATKLPSSHDEVSAYLSAHSDFSSSYERILSLSSHKRQHRQHPVFWRWLDDNNEKVSIRKIGEVLQLSPGACREFFLPTRRLASLKRKSYAIAREMLASYAEPKLTCAGGRISWHC